MVGKDPDSLHSRFSKGFALERIKIILENNNCYFNNKFYREISGTGMGSSFPPTDAIYVLRSIFIIFANSNG